MDVLDALATIDDRLPDGQLIALAGAPGVDRASIEVRCRPARGNHGRYTVTWRQDDTSRTVEASSLSTALRRALRAAGAVSAAGRP